MTAKFDLERVIPKIQALMSKTTSWGATEAEAASAAAKVQELLAKYNLTMEDLTPTSKDGVIELAIDFFGLKVKQQWLIDLASIIADATYCKLLLSGRRPVMWFIGREENVRTAEYMYNNLGDRIGWLAYHRTGKYTEAFKKEHGFSPAKVGGVHSPKSWRNSWLVGALETIRGTLNQQRMHLETNNVSMNALAIRRGTEIDEFISKKYPKLGTHTSSRSRLNGGGYEAGLSDGKDINLNPALE